MVAVLLNRIALISGILPEVNKPSSMGAPEGFARECRKRCSPFGPILS